MTTTKSAGAGEDIPGLKYSVVLAEPFRSEVLARQTLGRTRDPNTTYIELVDIGFKQYLHTSMLRDRYLINMLPLQKLCL